LIVRLATYNIRKGGGRRAHLLARVVASLDADLLVLQEATNAAVVRELATAGQYEILASAPGRSVAVLGRERAVDVEWHRGSQGPAFVVVNLPAADLRIIGVHLSAGMSARGERRRARELEQVLDTAARGPGSARVVIAGDLNAIARGDVERIRRLPMWIRVMLRIDGGIETAVIDRALRAGYVDTFRTLNDSPGATMPSGAPSVRLDYFLAGPELAGAATMCAIPMLDPALLASASDHLPLVLDLDLDRRVPGDDGALDRETGRMEPSPAVSTA
jgi:endonuclease/exonuclease/phosphatase family metal-dependent hydrolase